MSLHYAPSRRKRFIYVFDAEPRITDLNGFMQRCVPQAEPYVLGIFSNAGWQGNQPDFGRGLEQRIVLQLHG